MSTRSTALVLSLVVLAAGCSSNKPAAYPYDIESAHSVRSAAFERSINALLRRPIVPGNAIQTLVNGDEIFPAMLQGISAAKATIVFETFVYWSGEIADQFAEAIAERARAGIAVHVLIDAVGGMSMSEELVDTMRESGADVRFYAPIDILDPETIFEANYRTHRKVLVVDGRVGFIGGVGIGQQWTGDARNPEEWRDNHYRVEGPVVAQLQSVFFDNWVDTTGKVLHDVSYYPDLQERGELAAQVVSSSSESDGSKVQLMFLLAVAGAREEILLATPYFVPDDLTVRELLRAREREVTVRLLVPGPRMNKAFVRSASRARWGELLEAGVEFYEYQPTMMHAKLTVVDGYFVSIGSANLDNRSFSLNDEANLNVFDEKFAARQQELFEKDLQQAERITEVEWEERGFFVKLWGGFASLFGGQL